jgi:hypothetical protein
MHQPNAFPSGWTSPAVTKLHWLTLTTWRCDTHFTTTLPPPLTCACLLYHPRADPIAAWIDAGMAEVRPDISNAAYGASHTFVEDWRTHRVWDYLNSSHWKFIPTDDRLLDVQVRRLVGVRVGAGRGGWGGGAGIGRWVPTQKVHPANPSIIQSCDSRS